VKTSTASFIWPAFGSSRIHKSSAPNQYGLCAKPDFLNIVRLAAEKMNLSGIYNLYDDQPLLLHEFLVPLARRWVIRRRGVCWNIFPMPRRRFAKLSRVFAGPARGSPAIGIAMGMTSLVADTSRMKREFAGKLNYPTSRQALEIL
jgi:hypothetical protein